MRATLIIPGEKITVEDVEVRFVPAQPPPHGDGKAAGFLAVPYSLCEMFNRHLPTVLVVEDVGGFEVEIGTRHYPGKGEVPGSFEVLKAPAGWAPPGAGP